MSQRRDCRLNASVPGEAHVYTGARILHTSTHVMRTSVEGPSADSGRFATSLRRM